MIDVNDEKPEVPIYLKRVGVSNVYIPTFSMVAGDKLSLIALKVNAYIDLSRSYRGIHLSRNCESIIETFNKLSSKKLKVEDFCKEVAVNLLRKHRYASRSEVRVKGNIVFPRKTPVTRKISYEKATLIGRSIAEKKQSKVFVRRFIGLKISGITACPSAQRTIAEKLKCSDIGSVPIATHMQRGYATIIVEIPNKFSIDVLGLVEVAKNALSSLTYELLKKEDEVKVIIDALNRPRLAEDVVRFMAEKLIEKFQGFPDEMRIYLRYKSLESIHSHNLIAEYSATMGELRREFNVVE